jgi:pullulanase/glycogen debranching enzyme
MNVSLRATARRWLALAAALLPLQAWAALAPPDVAACNASHEGAHASVVAPVATAMAQMPAAAAWLNQRLLRWGGLVSVPPGARVRLHHAQRGGISAVAGQPVSGADGSLLLQPHMPALPKALQDRWRWFGPGPVWAVAAQDLPRMSDLHRGQLVLVLEDATGRVLQATRVQLAAALDALYASAESEPRLGAHIRRASDGGPSRRKGRNASTHFALWAPTAQAVWLCLHADGQAPAQTVHALQREARAGIWRTAQPRDLSGHTYTYLVDVFVPSAGLVRNRVTDPYALSLNTDSRRTWVGHLNDAALKPPGWDSTQRPQRVKTATDLVMYELHVRDFSITDTSVPEAHRGKYTAFAQTGSRGMQHLKLLSQAGVTDVHLLPVFDLATVPEAGCTSPTVPAGLPPDSAQQQAAVMAQARSDCFNWGYDPLHFTAPEGSFASDASDGAVRIREFRSLVQALHRAGLRVGMDVVYNHTSASGQSATSVLDRIVPGYYQRLDAQGKVETSTCCDNTATEHRMMAKLMIDSAVVWARDYRIDSFRFDLMGHQPRDAMLRLQRVVNAAAGRHIHLIGEGWNFGEVKDGRRFVQASQNSLNGTGIATFSDRARDAARGGGCCDDPTQTVQRQGWVNGLYTAPNGHALKPATAADLMQAADLVRVGLAGTLRSYRMPTHDGSVRALHAIPYAGQGAGYASQPGEVVNYVENHDNQTLFDINALKLPRPTSAEDRARVQVLGLALTGFSQGLAYFHAGVELLRSKSGDRNSYDSGDWFNRLDWSLQDNHWGTGLPPKADNEAFWPALKPLLSDPALKPGPEHIRFTRDAFLDLLRIRASSVLFRLPSAQAVQQRLQFLNTGPQQNPAVVVGLLNGRGLPGARFAQVLYLINTDTQPAQLQLPELHGAALQLHPVHQAASAADKRVAADASWQAQTATVRIPPRAAVVFVAP